MTCAPSEDSDQPGHLPSLIKVFAVHSIEGKGPKLSSCGQWKLIRLGKCPGWSESSLGICPVWSKSLLCAQWEAKDPSFLHVDSEDWSDWADAQADLPRLIWVFAGCTCHFVGFVMLWLMYLISTLFTWVGSYLPFSSSTAKLSTRPFSVSVKIDEFLHWVSYSLKESCYKGEGQVLLFLWSFEISYPTGKQYSQYWSGEGWIWQNSMYLLRLPTHPYPSTVKHFS